MSKEIPESTTKVTSRQQRPDVPIPETPSSDYPKKISSNVIAGFGRGSSDLGIPTANIPHTDVKEKLESLKTGVYFGWAKITPAPNKKSEELDIECINYNDKDKDTKRKVWYDHGNGLRNGIDTVVLPMVMSIGWNPFYGNKFKAAEIHIMHQFPTNFYGANIKFTVLGYIRPELNYISKEALIEDIKTDIQIGLKTLENPAYLKFKNDAFFF